MSNATSIPARLQRNLAGEIVRLGRDYIYQEANFLQTGTPSLPSWLLAGQGTWGFTAPSATNSPALAKASTSGSLSATARLETNFNLGLVSYKEVQWTLGQLICDADAKIGIGIGFVVDGNTGGVELYQDETMATAAVRCWAADGSHVDQPVDYRLTDGDGTYPGIGNARHRKNISVLLRPTRGHFAVLRDGRDVCCVDVSATVLLAGNERPHVRLVADEAAVHFFEFGRAKLETWV